MIGQPIDTREDLHEGLQALATQHGAMRQLFSNLGPPPLRRVTPGFTALARIIIGQQVSTHAAAAIWTRLKDGHLVERCDISSATPDSLGELGVSRPKQAYLITIAQSDFRFSTLQSRDDTAAYDALTALPGVGPWTAEVYLLTALGRADVFPAGDVALQEASKQVLGLTHRPTSQQMAQIATTWSPWRAVAARLLWAYYATSTGREGLAT